MVRLKLTFKMYKFPKRGYFCEEVNKSIYISYYNFTNNNKKIKT